MILNTKQAIVAYRCPHCGAGVMSAVDLFSLSADLLKLKCDCGKSEMSVLSQSDGKLILTVPCLTCPTPHRFTVSRSLILEKELFSLACPYSGLNVLLSGEMNLVKAELAKGELELLDMLEKSGIQDPSLLHTEADPDAAALPDPQLMDIVMFVIHDLDAEGKIYCRCSPDDNDREYDAEMTRDGILVSCRKCHASRLIPTDSSISAHAFLNSDSLYLE